MTNAREASSPETGTASPASGPTSGPASRPAPVPLGPYTTLRQRNLLSHALGLARSHGMAPTRNHFCAAVGSPDEDEIIRLMKLGLMYRGAIINGGRDFYAHVTPAGAAELGVELRRED